MRSAAFILLVCLLSVHVKGLVISSRGRCHCMDAGVKFIPPKQIEKIEVYSPQPILPTHGDHCYPERKWRTEVLESRVQVCKELHQECTKAEKEPGVNYVMKYKELPFT